MQSQQDELKNKVKFRNSLMAKVNGTMIIMLIIFISILGVIINTSVSKEITNLARARNLEVATSLQIEANAFFDKAENTVQLISHRKEIKTLNKSEMLRIFKKIKTDQTYFDALYLGTTTGEMILHPKADLPESFDPRSRPWYKKAKNENTLIWSDVYLDATSKKPIITVAMPIHNSNDEFVGILGGDISLETLSQKVASRKIGKSGYAYMINNKGEIIAHPNKKMVEEQFNVNKLFDAKSILNKDQGSIEYEDNGFSKLASYVSINRINGAIFAQAPFKQIYAQKDKLGWLIFIYSIIIVTVLGVTLYFINTKYLLKPINNLINKISKVAKGDFTIQTKTGRKDEIGQLEAALDKMSTNLKNIIIKLSGTIEELSAYSEELSASAEEGNATIETTNNLLEEMSSNIQQISASAQEVTSVAQETSSQAKIGGNNINDTVGSIQEINEAVGGTVKVINNLDNNSQEIGQIVELITDIAEQTNLLALNAAIEAARAGEHGQGFAVVAEEIRELAEETAKATDEITTLVKQTQKQSNNGLESVKQVEVKAKEGKEIAVETGEVFKKIESSIDQTSDYIQQTANSTQNLAQNSDQIMTASQDISNMSQEVTNSAQELATMAQELQNLVEQFEV
ncbi:methyl-accepting chemotaxis protein [Selenihalanaerobacter shriftii]|uniref:Methyl-accepting chemotaxis protein n=1 Tax=Selenihalanaerobacter shriftii TaxID=142842 RepID=A0A1T4NXR4_9FIRM|nr:methyl-accepting chemotaxis protein [Selenihalanaerobacter shriftii]SJZ84064.1 methyl-accepting chemotaxis protein [Selenihalanaerobacter shriftii]